MTIAPAVAAKFEFDRSSVPLRPSFQLPPPTWDPSSNHVSVMPIEDVVIENSRPFELKEIESLTESIREHGVIEPLVVTPDGRVLVGRRRLESARRAGLLVVPVRVSEVADQRAAIQVSLIENIERAAPNPMTLAHAYDDLIQLGSTVDEIARLVGQDEAHVSKHLALLDLHSNVQAGLESRSISFTTATALLALDRASQAELLIEIFEAAKPLNARQIKARVDARRVMAMVRGPNAKSSRTEDTLVRNYDELVQSKKADHVAVSMESAPDPFAQLNLVVAEMVAAADGEDDLRRWARRLSCLIPQLRESQKESKREKKDWNATQDRLL